MRLQRMDLGVDIVVVADQDLVILHPDLSYGEAMGALLAAFPALEPAEAARMAGQVTQRPRGNRHWTLVAGVITLITVLGGVQLASNVPDIYGPQWNRVAANIGLECHRTADSKAECVGRNGARYVVSAFSRAGGDLYILRSSHERRYVRVFDESIPQEWRDRNPQATVLSRSTVLWR